MSESQSRAVGSTGKDDGGRAAWHGENPGQGSSRGRRPVVIGVLGALVALGAVLIQTRHSLGQEPPPKAEVAREPAPAQPQESAEPLSIRYRFIEKYGLAPDLAKPELITEYLVGSLETIKTET
jgi:hypothetical protein